jgi:uncharacterized protein YcaQ
MAINNLQQLRIRAISQIFFPPTTLKIAIERLGFVQADPIRSPARAQDLILRHRVRRYRAGDLERRYAALNIEEDYLYAYGFLPRPLWRLLHPRDAAGISKLEKKVLEFVRGIGRCHPGELEKHCGKDRVVNAWGGYSKATKAALEDLHYRGLLRIAGRKNGIRVYEATSPVEQELSPDRRLRKLAMALANIFAPSPRKSLTAAIARYRRLGNPRAVLDDLLRGGELEEQTIDGVSYIWPARKAVHDEAPRAVRFLAPFDPLVWDRRRFEHLWNWPYRFEAYTPRAKRVRGYYAMPLLWREDVIGWVNANVTGGRLNVEPGFVGTRPREKDFQSELDAEIGRIGDFLNSRG